MTTRLADQVWSLLEQALTHRVVLELADVDSLDDALLDELVLLEERILKHDGMMRICGLSTANQRRLEQRLVGQFSGFRDAEEAVMGLARLKPR